MTDGHDRLLRRRPTPERLDDAIRVTTHDPAHAAKADSFGRLLRREHSARVAADLIEALPAVGGPGHRYRAHDVAP